MHLDAVLAAAFARRDDGSLSAPWLEDQDGISLLCQLLYERSTAGRAYLFIAVTDEGHLRVVRLLALYQKVQGVHADQYTRFHIQYAGAGSMRAPSCRLMANGLRPASPSGSTVSMCPISRMRGPPGALPWCVATRWSP